MATIERMHYRYDDKYPVTIDIERGKIGDKDKQDLCIEKIIIGLDKYFDMFSTGTLPNPKRCLPVDNLVIKFSDRMESGAGRALAHPTKGNLISLSNKLLNHCTDEFVDDTPVHELGHIVEYHVYGSTAHSSRFYQVCELLGHPNPKRCHNMRLDPSERTSRTSRKFIYKCGCNTMSLGIKRHNKNIRAGRVIYKCKSCKETLEFVKEL
jgi:predicted SprT family Zn-dependent metalloprotease